MNSFNSKRCDLLRVGSLGVAGAAIPVVSFAAASGQSPAPNTEPISAIFNVRQYGAAGDGKTLDTDAINRAIDGAASAGGGVVLFSPGTYLCFSIHLKSNVHLHLEEGSAILTAESPLPGQTTGYNGGAYDAPRTMRYDGLRNPSAYELDASVRRTFDITERWKFVFGADCQNLPSKVNFSGIQTAVDSSNFGTVTGATSNSGSRDFQFSGRINF
ncbi:MAG: glycosyl hydrolase family 28-related protein [Terriglobales bacterium]|jgi:hypothetical protein